VASSKTRGIRKLTTKWCCLLWKPQLRKKWARFDLRKLHLKAVAPWRPTQRAVWKNRLTDRHCNFRSCRWAFLETSQSRPQLSKRQFPRKLDKADAQCSELSSLRVFPIFDETDCVLLGNASRNTPNTQRPLPTVPTHGYFTISHKKDTNQTVSRHAEYFTTYTSAFIFALSAKLRFFPVKNKTKKNSSALTKTWIGCN